MTERNTELEIWIQPNLQSSGHKSNAFLNWVTKAPEQMYSDKESKDLLDYQWKDRNTVRESLEEEKLLKKVFKKAGMS